MAPDGRAGGWGPVVPGVCTVHRLVLTPTTTALGPHPTLCPTIKFLCMGPRRGLRLPRSRRSSGDRRAGTSPHPQWHAAPSEGESRITAGSSVAAEWPDPEGGDGAAIPVRRLRLNLRAAYGTGWLWPLQMAKAMAKACAEWATSEFWVTPPG